MGFHATLRIKDGQIAQVKTDGTLPEGQLEIHGHEDHYVNSLSVAQRDGEGRFVTSAAHTQLKAGHLTERPLLEAEPGEQQSAF